MCKSHNKNRTFIMVWLCSCSTGDSVLLLCDHVQDSASYQDNILSKALYFLRRRATNRHDDIIFQQDGAPCHTSKSTKKSGSNRTWLKSWRIGLLKVLFTPFLLFCIFLFSFWLPNKKKVYSWCQHCGALLADDLIPIEGITVQKQKWVVGCCASCLGCSP